MLTPDKSAILTGKPGIGKTAIVEGLAYLIQRNEVPDALKGYTIIKIDTQALMGTVKETGDSRVQTLIDEILENEKYILSLPFKGNSQDLLRQIFWESTPVFNCFDNFLSNFRKWREIND